MKILFRIFALVTMVILCACASREIRPQKETGAESPDSITSEDAKSSREGEILPPPETRKGSETLKLVRVLEGGVCKNDEQGAKGVFLLYSSPDDIARLKKEKGAQIFSEYEKQIQGFSLVAFDKAVRASDIGVDPFALDNADAQRKVAKQVVKEFDDAIENDVTQFEKTTTLTIDVKPFEPYLEFYVNECEATHTHSQP